MFKRCNYWITCLVYLVSAQDLINDLASLCQLFQFVARLLFIAISILLVSVLSTLLLCFNQAGKVSRPLHQWSVSSWCCQAATYSLLDPHSVVNDLPTPAVVSVILLHRFCCCINDPLFFLLDPPVVSTILYSLFLIHLLYQ